MSLLADLIFITAQIINVTIPAIATIFHESPWNPFAIFYILYVRLGPSTRFLNYLFVHVLTFLVNFFFWLVAMDGVVMCFSKFSYWYILSQMLHSKLFVCYS